ncbi:MAG: SAM-dependent methyltransferase [Lachnospiraceae bacterium]|nr:SAM-dependent methyltransferase [Lachnospiraceae bacterium]
MNKELRIEAQDDVRESRFGDTGVLRGNARLLAAAGMIADWVNGCVDRTLADGSDIGDGRDAAGRDGCGTADRRSGRDAADGAEAPAANRRKVVFADIGTDHAYLPIALCEAHVVDRAIAADVKEGPLAIAKTHIAGAGLSDRIEPRLSDGLSNIAPGEADVIAICGMGGELLLRILETNIPAAKAAEYLVLGPQSKVRKVRVGLRERGFRIITEDMVSADGKYYPLIGAVPKKNEVPQAGKAADEELFDRYGYDLLRKRHPVLRSFLKKEKTRLTEIKSRTTGARRQGIEHQLLLCERALLWMTEDI